MTIVGRIIRLFYGLILLLIVLVLIGDIIFYIWLKGNPEKVAEMIRSRTAGKVEVASVTGEMLFGLSARDVVVFPSDDPTDQRLLRAENIEIDISWISLFQLHPFPKKITADDFDLFFTIDENGKLVFPSFATHATQGGVQSGPLDLRHDVKFELTRGSVYFIYHAKDSPPMQAEIREVESRGSLRRAGVIEINKFTGKPRFAKGKISVSGWIDPFATKSMVIELSGAQVSLLDVSEFLSALIAGAPHEMLPRGTASCKVSIRGPFSEVTVDGDIDLTAGRLINLDLNTASIHFSYSKSVLKLIGCKAQAYGGSVNLDAEARFILPRPGFKFAMDFTGVDVNSYIEQVGLYFQETAGDFQGHFEGYGEFADPESFLAEGYFASMGGTYRSPYGSYYSGSTERLSYDALRVDFEAAHGTVSIRDIYLDGDDLSIVARGTIDSKTDLELKGQMKFPRKRATEIPSLKRWAGILSGFSGSIILDFTLKGNLTKPKFEASLPLKIIDFFKDEQKSFFDWFKSDDNESN